MKNKNIVVLVAFFLLVFNSSLFAEEDMLIRVNPQPENPWVGEKVVLEVDVLARNGWAQLLNSRHARIDGGFLRRYETQGTRLNETIDGESYTGQRYEYLFFPQRTGKQLIPAIPLDVEIKTWGQSGGTKTARMETPPFSLMVRIPEILKSTDGFISTTEFTAVQEWVPEAEDISAGDAITRTITLQAKDVSGMVFTPLQHGAIESVSAYPAEPVVNDSYNLGDLEGERIEKVTYVFEQGGAFNLPDFSFSWWNISTEKLETITLAGKSVQVRGMSSIVKYPEPQTVNKNNISGLVLITAVALVIAAFIYAIRSRLKASFAIWKQRHSESENQFFKEVAKAAGKNDMVIFLQAAMRWLDRISTDTLPARMDLFLRQYGDEGAEDTFSEMLKAYSSNRDSSSMAIKTSTFFKTLVRARKRWRKMIHRKKKAELLLPEIALR